MNLAYRHGVDRIWIVNVGDIKPMESPTELFLDLARAPERFSTDQLGDYADRWAEEQSGPRAAARTGKLLIKYAHPTQTSHPVKRGAPQRSWGPILASGRLDSNVMSSLPQVR